MTIKPFFFFSILFALCHFLVFSQTNEVADCFQKELDVLNYTNHSDLQWDWAMDALSKYQWEGHERVLYVGSRDGKVAAKIANSLPKGLVVGIDNAKNMVQYASSSNHYSNLVFLSADICQPLFYEQFDLVVSSCYLHWLEDQLSALKTIKNSLKVEGQAILVMPAKYPTNLSTVSDSISNTPKWKPYFTNRQIKKRYYHDQEEYQKLLIEAGLEPLDISQTILEDFFPSRQALIDWVIPISSFMQVLPEEKQREFVEDVVDEMLAQNSIEADGSIYLKSAKLAIIAKKKSN